MTSAPNSKFWSLSEKSSSSITINLHQSVFCVTLVAFSDSNLEEIQSLILNIRHRGTILIANSTQHSGYRPGQNQILFYFKNGTQH